VLPSASTQITVFKAPPVAPLMLAPEFMIKSRLDFMVSVVAVLEVDFTIALDNTMSSAGPLIMTLDVASAALMTLTLMSAAPVTLITNGFVPDVDQPVPDVPVSPIADKVNVCAPTHVPNVTTRNKA
jgi:hypothetical protein